MKKLYKSIILAAAMLLTASSAGAQSISDILGGLGGLIGGGNGSSQSAGGSSTLGNLLEGVFSSSNITVADMAGVWTSNGPAVCFQSDNFLQKAGGVAAASMIEKELSSYYEQYGLNGAVVTINTDATFSMKLKHITLKGNITPDPSQKGVFQFTFTALGAIRIGSITTYAQKSYKTMNLMFDATKLKTLISAVARLSGIQLAQTLSKLLDSYEGLCVGFRLERTGDVRDQTSSPYSYPGNNRSSNQSTKDGSGLGTLLDLLGGSGSK